jgi:hypothetical protein
MEVRVVALSGKELATFSAEASCTVAELQWRAAAVAGPWPGSVYMLMLGDRVLDISDTLAQASSWSCRMSRVPCSCPALVIARHGPLVGAAGSLVPSGSDVADGVAACEFGI